jgi:hypothetical protein
MRVKTEGDRHGPRSTMADLGAKGSTASFDRRGGIEQCAVTTTAHFAERRPEKKLMLYFVELAASAATPITIRTA